VPRRPPGSNWGDYGKGDRLGRLNELTAERVRRAAQEIVTGERFCLSLPLDFPGGQVVSPTRKPPVLQPNIRHGKPAVDLAQNVSREGARGVSNDDFVTMWLQYSTQWDALGHVGNTFDADGDGNEEVLYYNGVYPAPDITPLAEFPVQGRGVLVDLHRRYGDDDVVVDYAMLADVMKDQNVTIEPGDILCLHTGFARKLLEWNKQPDPHGAHHVCSKLDGADPELQRWVTDSGIAALTADNHAVEVIPARWREKDGDLVPLHQLCLFKLGIPLGEMWYFSQLAEWLHRNNRSRFFLTAPGLRLPGAVGSPLTPVATV
jgi:kynurenine formamidase